MGSKTLAAGFVHFVSASAILDELLFFCIWHMQLIALEAAFAWRGINSNYMVNIKPKSRHLRCSQEKSYRALKFLPSRVSTEVGRLLTATIGLIGH